MLLNRWMTAAQISREVRQPVKDTETDLHHLLKSLEHTEYTAEVRPARCRKCGFEFGPEKLSKPSRCPECKGTWLSEPRIQIQARKTGSAAL